MTGRQRLTVLAAVLVGAAAGLGAFTFVYAKGLRITPRNLEVTENACRFCHTARSDVIEHGAGKAGVAEARGRGEPFLCTRWHNDVGHWVR